MSDDNQNKSHWSSIFNWNMIKKIFTVLAVLVVIYVIMIVLSPLFKLGRNVAGAWDAAWNVIGKAFDGLCAKSGTCLPGSGQTNTPSSAGTCNSGNPNTKGNQCSLSEQEANDADKKKDASDGPCGSEWNGWCALFPIGIGIMFLVGGPAAFFGWIGEKFRLLGKKTKDGFDSVADMYSAYTGKDLDKIIRESTDGVAEYKDSDTDAVDTVMGEKYSKGADGKFTPDALTNLGIKFDWQDYLDDAVQGRGQAQYDKLRKMQIDNLQFKRQRSVIEEKNKSLEGTNKKQYDRLTKRNTTDILENQTTVIAEATKDAGEAAENSAKEDAEKIEEKAEIPKAEGV